MDHNFLTNDDSKMKRISYLQREIWMSQLKNQSYKTNFLIVKD